MSMGQPISAAANAFELERAALDRLLQTGIFDRSPNLEKILRYLSQKRFDGESAGIKEFHIATEALGRLADFDPKRDSIVRVEMHRLRKRLRDHYAGLGASEPIILDIPDKSYQLEFRQKETAPAPVVVPLVEAPAPRVNPFADFLPNRPRVWYLLGGLLLVTVAVGFGAKYLGSSTNRGENRNEPPVTSIAATSSAVLKEVADFKDSASERGSSEEIRLLSGRMEGRYVDPVGHSWQTDQYFHDGTAEHVKNQVFTQGLDPNAFAYMREGQNFRYDIPLKPGYYELMLLFAETVYGEGNRLGGGQFSRQFDVLANHTPLLEAYDVIADAGQHNSATAQVFHSILPSRDGMLHLQFRSLRAGTNAFVNGIIIRPGQLGKLRPIRILCRPETYQDSKKQLWEQDRFYRGGKSIIRPTGPPIEDTDLFTGERYGDFTYSIPVTPGKYTVQLYFNEFWWGPNGPGTTKGPGLRMFNVFAQHQTLLQNFDIAKESGPAGYTIKTFRGLTPNRFNKLVLDFVTKTNNAMLNAIEVIPE